MSFVFKTGMRGFTLLGKNYKGEVTGPRAFRVIADDARDSNNAKTSRALVVLIDMGDWECVMRMPVSGKCEYPSYALDPSTVKEQQS